MKTLNMEGLQELATSGGCCNHLSCRECPFHKPDCIEGERCRIVNERLNAGEVQSLVNAFIIGYLIKELLNGK